ncbi:MAG: hypothetical protein BWY64_04004 [bacterium ADurb.Bin363]|nr:MAG: hypothetical protein BWY64_04004 [bacterium ADurb.Bin363]
MKGVYVGKVGKVNFSSKSQKAKVTLKIDYWHKVPENSIYLIQSGLIGEQWVYIDPNPLGKPVEPGTEAEGVTPISMGDNYRNLMVRLDAFNKNIENIKKKTENIYRIVGDEQFKRDMKEKILNIKASTAQYNKTIVESEDTIEEFFHNFQEGLFSMSYELAIMARNIRNNIALVLGGVSSSIHNLDKKVNIYGNDIAVIVCQLKKASEELALITENITETLDPNSGIPPKVRGALLSLRESCMFIEEGAQEILAFSEKGPAYQRDIKETLANVRKAMDRIDGTLTGMLGYVHEGTEEESHITGDYEILITRNKDDFNADLYANIYWTKEKDMFLNLGIADVNANHTTINAQLGKIVKPDLRLRGGIVKSSLGAGVDYGLTKNTTVSFDIFDFSEHNAFIDFKGRYRIQKHFELILGVDDLLNEKEIKAGIGITF